MQISVAQDVGAPAPTVDRQVFAVETARTSYRRLYFSPLEPVEGMQPRQALPVKGSVLSRIGVGDRHLTFSVEAADGKVVYSIDQKVTVESGSTPYGLEWPTAGVPEGDYTAKLRVVDPTLGDDARVEWRVFLRSGEAVAGRVESARANVGRLRDWAGPDAPREVRQTIALALDALAPFPSSDRPLIEADLNARFADTTANRLRARLVFGWRATVSAEHPRAISSHDGNFIGGVVLGDSADVVDRLDAFGCTFAPMTKTALSLTPTDSSIPAMLWMSGGETLPQAHSAEDLKVAASGGPLAAISLWTGLEAAPIVPELRDEFRVYLSHVYADRVALSSAWRKNFASFEQADFLPSNPNRAYQYDVQAFQRSQISAWASQQLREAQPVIAPATPTLTFTESLFKAGEARNEPDAESLADSVPILSVRSAGPLSDARFAQRFPAPQMMYALFHSYAPTKPLVAMRSFQYTTADRLRLDSAAQVRTAAIEAALEGVSALAIEFPDLPDPVSSAPEGFAGLTAALHDLHRAADAVSAFRAADATVGIVWSDSSRLFDNGTAHLRAVEQAYEGCSFSGQKIGFITERQLAEGRWHGTKVVVLPAVAALTAEARAGLESLIASGVSVVRTEQGPSYDEHGRALGKILSIGHNAELIRGRGEPHEYLDALDHFNTSQVLPDVPRAVTANSYPIEGVKTRYAEAGDAHYLYIVNLRKDSVMCRLTRPVGIATDMLTGRSVMFPCALEPLHPMILRVEAKPGDATPKN